MSNEIDAIRERLQQEDYDADAWETNGYAQLLYDAERLLAALDECGRDAHNWRDQYTVEWDRAEKLLAERRGRKK